MEFLERAARNEQVFRSVNNHIDEAAGRHGRGVPLRFHCECGRASCFETIDMLPDTFERVAATRYRFIVLPGHEEREFERVVETHDGWLVVEKFGDARDEVDRARSA